LAIQQIVVKLLSEFNVWYIDVGTIGCILSDILHGIHIIKAEGEMIGVTLNESKCELITSDHEVVLAFRNILPSVTHLIRVTPSKERVERVWAPGRTFEKSQHTRRLLSSEKLFWFTEAIVKFEISAMLRSQIINSYDDSIRSTLQVILNVTLTDDGWLQAKLPVKHCGLGVLSASDLALPAFLASVFGSAELSLKLLSSSSTQHGGTNVINYKYYMDIWQSITKTPTPDSLIAANQKI